MTTTCLTHSSTVAPPDVCIRGGGIVGRTLALLLARYQLHIVLVDSPVAAVADIRAYALNHASRQLLQSIRCWPDAAHATAVERMQIWGDGAAYVQFDAHSLQQEAMTWIVDVPALEGQLLQACQYQPNITIMAFDAAAHHSMPAASLTVICEGRHSATRQALGVTYHTRPYAQQAIATRIMLAQPHGQVARQWFSHDGHTSHILAFLPLGGADSHEAGVVWSVPPAYATHLLALSDDDFIAKLQTATRPTPHGDTVQISHVQRRMTWPLQLGFAQQWAGHDPHYIPLSTDEKVKSGRYWVLAGDAAHGVHPLAGQGLNLGLADVALLAQLIGQRPSWCAPGNWQLLRQYERTRKAAIAPLMAGMDGIQRLFSHTAPAVQNLRNWGMQAFAQLPPLQRWAAQQAMQGTS